MLKTLITLAIVATAAACHHDAPANNPGPMQKAGASVDHGAQNVKDATQDAAHDVKEDLKK